MPRLLGYAGLLVVMAGLSLAFGALAGTTCAKASCGFARNLRRDMFYKIQGYSFENIDKFSVSSLVTRLTTDVTNVQMAYMMIIRGAIRSPLMLIFSFIMGFIMGGKMAFIFLVTVPILGIGLNHHHPEDHAPVPPGLPQVRQPERPPSRRTSGHAGGKGLRPGGL